MSATTDTTIEVTHRGDVDPRLTQSLVDKVLHTASHAREPVRHIEAKLLQGSNPAMERPAEAECALDLDGPVVRAHVAASTMPEAIDLLVDRLARRLRRHEQQRHRLTERHRTGDSGEGEWRHGDLPTVRPEWHPVPFDERELRRRKSFALAPTSIEEALFDLDQLGHDFYLFVELSSGLDAVVGRNRDGELELRSVAPDAIDAAQIPDGVTVIHAPPPVLDLPEAREYLETSGGRWLFHRPGPMARGHVLYRRYDGHDGIISAT
jgi:ribosome-associated translation inhibitor RaiA